MVAPLLLTITLARHLVVAYGETYTGFVVGEVSEKASVIELVTLDGRNAALEYADGPLRAMVLWNTLGIGVPTLVKARECYDEELSRCEEWVTEGLRCTENCPAFYVVAPKEGP